MKRHKTRIVRAGNSSVICIPEHLIEQAGLGACVEVTARAGRLVIGPANVRDGWKAAFKDVAEHGGDRLLDPEMPTKWDLAEWSW